MIKKLKDIHFNEYENTPKSIAVAPGRFHLVGDHSWFFKDKTLSMAVNLPVYVSVSKNKDSIIRSYFYQIDDRKRSGLSNLKNRKEDRWANALKSVVYGFLSAGFEITGIDVTVYSEILPSAGFGITTAIKVAFAIALKNLFDISCADVQLIQVIERANRLFLQQESHIGDIYSALYSKRGNLICTDYSKNSYCNFKVPFEGRKVFLVDASVPRFNVWNEDTLHEPENALLLGDLRESKNNVFGGWKYIDNVTDINEELSVVSEDTKRKLLCVMREHYDVLEALSALEKNDFSKFARAINHSHESLRDFYDLSCPEIDWILKRVLELEPNLESTRNPETCGRITGKGFGRCVYTIIRPQDVEKFMARLYEYEKIFGFKPKCYEVHSADGAKILEVNDESSSYQ